MRYNMTIKRYAAYRAADVQEVIKSNVFAGIDVSLDYVITKDQIQKLNEQFPSKYMQKHSIIMGRGYNTSDHHYQTEIEKEICFVRKKDIHRLTGDILGQDKNGKIYTVNPTYRPYSNTLIVGTFGSEKDSFVYNNIMQCIRRRESVVATIYNKAKAELFSEEAQKAGYSIKVMSLTFKQEDIDPVLPMKQPCMYFTLPAIDNSVNMFYNHLFAEQSIYAYEHMDNKSSFVPVNYFLSDFTSLGEISNFGRFLCTSRSKKIKVNMILDSVDQLKARYPSNYLDIINSANTQLLYSHNDTKELPNDYIKPDEVLVCIDGLSSVILKKYPWKRNPILKKIARSQGLTNS